MLLAIGGLFSHFLIFLLLIVVFAAIVGTKPTPAANPATTRPSVPSSQLATATTTAPPTEYIVTEARSGDSVVVSDGTRAITVTVAGIDAADITSQQCWAAEGQKFAADTLIGQKIVLEAALGTTVTVPQLILTDGRDFAVIAASAGVVRAVADTASAPVREAESAAKVAGLGLWGAPCLGQLVAPAPVQPPPVPPAQEPPAPAPPSAEPQPEPEPEPQPDVYYPNCAAARAAGAAPLYRGEPGYRPGLDRDGDGKACE